uniref:Retrotransposon Copia-like N-terminal domain-containing protein n=1 Tax=Chenopodium quinoa TaxID=63459 RepID=A0A803LC78_CHEQI
MAASTDPQIQTQNSVNFADPYYLSNGDHPGMQLGNHILTGSNFLNWSRTVRMALIARNKLQFVDGTLPSPSPDYQKWIRNDYMVMSWLLNSVDKSLAESFMFVNSSADLWKEISERFGQSNAPQVFELHISLSSSNQNNDSIAEYYGRLKSVWDQLQILEGFPDCTCEALKLCSCGVLKKILEMDQRRKLMQLLAGLNRNYDQVKTNLLSLDPLPSINKAYHTLQQIEQQNKLNLLATNSVETNSMNAAANAVMTPKVFPKPSYMQNPDYKKIKSDLLCTHCKKRGHGVDSCFKLYGVPTWYTELKRKAPANVRLAGNASGSAGILGKAPVQGDEHGSSISSADPTAMTHMYNELLRMIQNKSPSSLDNPLSSAINFAGTTIAFHVDNLKHVFDKTAWIIDTGASDHMVGNLDLFASIHKLKNPIKVSLPDGTFTFVLYAGSVALTVDLLIHNVFYIPSFKHNLLSVGRLLDHHSLVAHFEKDSCLFQDLVSKQVKAVRTRFSGLYKFSSTSSDFHSSVNNIQHVDVSMLANNLITKSVLPSIDVVHARKFRTMVNPALDVNPVTQDFLQHLPNSDSDSDSQNHALDSSSDHSFSDQIYSPLLHHDSSSPSSSSDSVPSLRVSTRIKTLPKKFDNFQVKIPGLKPASVSSDSDASSSFNTFSESPVSVLDHSLQGLKLCGFEGNILPEIYRKLIDLMTKPLGAEQHKFLSLKLGLISQVPSQDWSCCVQAIQS